MSGNTIIPNSYQTPNAYADDLMPLLTGEEWKVLSYMTRRIFGWEDARQAGNAGISLTEIINGTGVAKRTAQKALDSLMLYGIAVLVAKGKGSAPSQWSLEIDKDHIDLAGLRRRKDGKSKAQRKKLRDANSAKRESACGSSHEPVCGSSHEPQIPEPSGSSHEPVSGSSHEPQMGAYKEYKQNKTSKPQAASPADATAKLRAAVFDRLEQQWLFVNPAQLDQHMALAERYGLEAWLRGFEKTARGKRSNASYVEKVVADVADELEEISMPPAQPSVVMVPAGAL